MNTTHGRSLLLTGSSGFIGWHLANVLSAHLAPGSTLTGLDIVPPVAPAGYRELKADIRCRACLVNSENVRAASVIHLAARAEVMIPIEEVADLMATNVNGTIHLLEAVQPQRFFFASTSAVYGNGDPAGATTDWHNVHPVGTYGMSKAMGELICSDWAGKTGGVAVMFRLGNVIGKKCRGLIPYLVDHAKLYPHGSVAAQGRGEGRLVRDYVPVEYVVKVIVAALESDWALGSATALNLGTGRGWTNGEVAEIVRGVLKQQGYELQVDWRNAPGAGESQTIVLDMRETVDRLGLPVPDREAVVDAIEKLTLSCLETRT